MPELFGRPYSTAAIVFALFLGGCASQAPPSGGPPDKTPPYVLTTLPASDSVRVGAESEIEITFSEPMERRSVEQAVFVSPRFSEDLSYKWKGRKLRLVPAEPLAKDRTYTVTVGAESRDVYRNKMVASHSFTFSTGDTLHDGAVTGRVRGATGRAVFVQAFHVDGDRVPEPADRAPYVTQAGDQGRFAFAGLSDGRYRVFAFEDVNADQAYDSGVERLAVPPSDVTLSNGRRSVGLAELQLAVRDSVPPRVVAVRTVDAQKLRIKLDETVLLPVDVRVSDGELSVVSQHHEASDSSVVFIVTTTQTEGVEYSLHFNARDPFGNASARDTVLTAKGDGRLDTRPPVLVRTDPSDNEMMAPGGQIVLTFDEAMSQTLPDSLWGQSDSTSVPAGRWAWIAPNRLMFEPEAALLPGVVRLQIRASDLTDLSGKPIEGDKLLTLNVTDERDLGSIAGQVSPDTTDIVMTVRRIERGAGRDVRVAAGDSAFAVSGLIPGQYVVTGYYDADGDGSWFPGVVSPFSFSEALIAQQDTVEVRDRWETVVDTRFDRTTEPYSGDRIP